MIVKSLNLSVCPFFTTRKYFLLRRLLGNMFNLLIIPFINQLSPSLNSNSVINEFYTNSPSNFFNKLLCLVLIKYILVNITYVFSLNHLSICTSDYFATAILISTLLHLIVRLHFRWTVIISNLIYTWVLNLLCINKFRCLFWLFNTAKLLFLCLVLTDNKLLLLWSSLINYRFWSFLFKFVYLLLLCRCRYSCSETFLS